MGVRMSGDQRAVSRGCSGRRIDRPADLAGAARHA